MRATIERDALRSALKITAPAVPRNPHNPALYGALIECTGDVFTITTTDLERSIRHTAGANVGTDGDVVVPHAVLRRIIDACGAGAVTLATDDASLSIAGAEGLTASVDTLSRSEWPPLATMKDESTTLEVDAELRTVFRRAACAVSHDDSRPVLTGIWLHANGLVSSADSYIGTHTPTAHALPEVTIPGDVIRNVLAIAGDGLAMTSDGDRVSFTSDGTTWASTCIQGDRPDVARLLPDKAGDILTVATGDLSDALASVSAMVDGPGESAHPIQITANDDTMTMRKTSRGIGEVAMALDCSSRDGLPNAVGVAPQNLAKVVGVLDCDPVDIDTHGESKPIAIRDGDTTFIIMPVRGVS